MSSERADIFCTRAEVLFHCCTQRHLGTKSIDSLLNTGNDKTHGFTNGPELRV